MCLFLSGKFSLTEQEKKLIGSTCRCYLAQSSGWTSKLNQAVQNLIATCNSCILVFYCAWLQPNWKTTLTIYICCLYAFHGCCMYHRFININTLWFFSSLDCDSLYCNQHCLHCVINSYKIIFKYDPKQYSISTFTLNYSKCFPDSLRNF